MLIKLSLAGAALIAAVLPLSAAEPIRIGAIYCDSGELAPLDGPSLAGARTAVALANQSGGIDGRKIELVHVPTGSSTEAVAASVRTILAKYPDVAGFVGLSDSGMALAAGREARRAKKVFITSGATSPLLPRQVGPGFFLACFGDNVQAAAAAEWLLRSKGARRVALLYDPRRIYTRLLQGYFAEAFEQGGGRITDRVAIRSGAEWDLPRGLAANDAVFLSVETASDAQTVIAKLRAAGFRGPVVGGDGYDNPAAWRGNELSRDIYFTTHAFPAVGRGAAGPAAVSDFRRGYRGGVPGAFSGLGYDATRLLIAALPARDGQLAGKVQNGPPLAGVTGQIAYAPGDRVPAKPVAIYDAARPDRAMLRLTPAVVPAP
jgi:branched-chain amino acid transport system substrate-binding protein